MPPNSSALQFCSGISFPARPAGFENRATSKNAGKTPKHIAYIFPLANSSCILQIRKYRLCCTEVFSITSEPEVFRLYFLTAHGIWPTPCVEMLPSVVVQCDFLLMEKPRRDEQRHLSIRHLVRYIVPAKLKGLKCRNQFRESVTESIIVAKLSNEVPNLI